VTAYDHLHIPLPTLPSYDKLTQPAKREYRYGVRARKNGSPITNNPWRRSVGGRNYYKFEDYWNMGWKACDIAIAAEGEKTNGDLGS
jgi:hypothetical protein